MFGLLLIWLCGENCIIQDVVTDNEDEDGVYIKYQDGEDLIWYYVVFGLLFIWLRGEKYNVSYIRRCVTRDFRPVIG